MFDFFLKLFGKDDEAEYLGEEHQNNNNIENYNTVPIADDGNRSFKMTIADVFTITGRGTVVTGQIASGEVRVGDKVIIYSKEGSKSTSIIGIETFRKLLDYAKEGDNIGLLLRNIGRNDVHRGDVICGMNEGNW